MKNSTLITVLTIGIAGGIGYLVWKKYKKGCGCAECQQKAAASGSVAPAITPAQAASQALMANITAASGSGVTSSNVMNADGFVKQ